jgi:hypothetical protein
VGGWGEKKRGEERRGEERRGEERRWGGGRRGERRGEGRGEARGGVGGGGEGTCTPGYSTDSAKMMPSCVSTA